MNSGNAFKKVIQNIISICIVLALAPLNGATQPNKAGPAEQMLFLKISSGYFTVVKEARVDLDSSLILSAAKNHLSRVSIVTEGIDNLYTADNCSWIDLQNPAFAQKQLALLKGRDNARMLLLLGAYYAFKPGRSSTVADSAINFLNLANDKCRQLKLPEFEAQSNCLLGKCYLKKNNIPEALACFRKVTEDHALQNLSIKAKAWSYLGTYFPFVQSALPMRIRSLQKALSIFMAINDRANQANTLMNLAYLNFAAINPVLSESFSKRSLAVQKSFHFAFTHYTNDLLALIAYTRGDYVSQLSYAMQSVTSATATADSLGLPMFYERVGDSFTGSSKTKNESIYWYRKAFEQFKVSGGDTQMYRLLSYLATESYGSKDRRSLVTFIKQLMIKYPPENSIDLQDAYQTLGNCYRRSGDYRQAEHYYFLAEGLVGQNEKIRGNLKNAGLQYNIGEFFFDRKNYSKSKRYLLKFISEPSSRINSPQNLLTAYWLLHTIDSSFKDKRSAMAYFQEFTGLRDSLLRNIETDRTDSTVVKITSKDILNTPAEPVTKSGEISGILSGFLFPSLVAILLLVIISFIIYKDFKDGRRLQEQLQQLIKKDENLQSVINTNKQLERTKDWVFNEIQQRVTDNLRIVLHVLSTQSAHLTDKFAAEALKQSQSRMEAMLLIHQSLYHNGDRSQVEMAGYIEKISSYLGDYFNSHQQIQFDLQLTPFSLDLNQAVPVGLILNEVITNSLKHGFRSGQCGIIRITAGTYVADRQIVNISVSDNGKGFALDFDINRIESLGISLITGLGAQLDAEVNISGHPGVSVSLEFRME